jgi:anti-sigma regulatory factor (Ser/Thr protein kinase)
MVTPGARPLEGPAGLRHEAAFYNGEAAFLGCTVPFVRAALEAEDPVLVMVGGPKLAALRAELGSDAAGVTFADMFEVGANPAWIIPAWRDFVDADAGAERFWGIGEPIWAGRSPAELVECQRHEQLLNLAFADAPPFWLLCPYDTASLDDDVVAEARASHPVLSWEPAATVPTVSPPTGSAEYAGPPDADFVAPLDPPAADAVSIAFDARSLRRLRAIVEARACELGMSDPAAAELVLAVHELAANSVRHAGGTGTLTVWRDGPTLLLEVGDAGRVADPLVGRVRPGPEAAGGRGMWLAHQLSALVQLRTSEAGTVVRLHATNDGARR